MPADLMFLTKLLLLDLIHNALIMPRSDHRFQVLVAAKSRECWGGEEEKGKRAAANHAQCQIERGGGEEVERGRKKWER